MPPCGTPAPEVLGRILLLQGAVHAEPDDERLAEMITTGLLDLPGVTGAALCHDGAVLAQAGDAPNPSQRCLLVGRVCNEACEASVEGAVRLPLRGSRRSYGALFLAVGDQRAFEPYRQFLENTAHLVALVMENREQSEQLMAMNRNLERQVAARTESLERELCERQRLERALRHSEQRSRDVIESLNEGVVLLNREWCVETANAEAASILGITAEALIADLSVLADWVAYREDGTAYLPAELPWAVTLSTGVGMRDQVMHVHAPGGRTTWVSVSTNPLFAPDDLTPEAVVVSFADVTKRKQAEDALIASERFLRQTQEIARIGGWKVNPHTDYLEWTEGVYQIIGVPPGRRLGLAEALAFYLPKYIPVLRERLVRTLETGEPFVEECEVMTVSGEHLWAEVRGLAHVVEGRNAFVVGTFQDITARKRAEAAITESEAKYRALIENTRDLIYRMSSDGLLTFASPSWTVLLGHDIEGVVGSHVHDYVHPDDMPTWRRYLRDVLTRKQELPGIEYRARHADGSWRWHTSTCTPLSDEAGRITEFVGVAHDITERKHAELALAESERQYRLLIENTHEIIYRLSPDYVFTFVSPSWADLLGHRAESVVGVRVRELLHPDDLDPCREKIVRVIEAGERFDNIEYRVRHADGTWRWHTSNIVPLRSGSGKVTGFVGIARDITQRRQADEERQKLEHQIQQTQKLESLGVLAGGIAHDFNNILMAVLGHADLALDALPPLSPAIGNIEQISTAARRAAGLCHQMLAYAGKATYKLEQVDLSILVGEMAHLLRTSVSKKAVLNLHLDEGLPRVKADASQMRQVAMNLLLNAAEAIGDGHGRITVSVGLQQCSEDTLRGMPLREELPPGHYVYLEVVDSGCGMDAATLDRIFEPFYSTKFRGRGLGLAAVLGIVRAHGGGLAVESEPGKGSTFTVLLPALNAEGAAARGEAPPAEPDTQRTGTVLLADDEDTVRSVTAAMLERIGFRVLTASDGREAVEAYREKRDEIVFVVLDLTMPNMDGAEAFAAIRAMDPDVKVALASGYSGEDITSRYPMEGLAAVIQKPYTLRALREVVAKLVTEGQPRDASPS